MIRPKKAYMVLAFSTTTAAMAMEKRCLENKIPGRLIPVPREITAGCGLAWRMGIEDYREYEEKVEKLEIPVEKKTELML